MKRPFLTLVAISRPAARQAGHDLVGRFLPEKPRPENLEQLAALLRLRNAVVGYGVLLRTDLAAGVDFEAASSGHSAAFFDFRLASRSIIRLTDEPVAEIVQCGEPSD